MSAIKPPPGFDFSLLDMIDAEGGRAEAYQQLVRGGTAGDAAAFCAVLEQDIDEAIANLEAEAPKILKDTEDGLSSRIVGFLRGRRYDAHSEPFERGHVDIQVRSDRQKLRWNGEAKIHGGYGYAIEGMKQLISRYDTGAHHHGGFFLYVRRKNYALIERKWRQKIGADTDPASCGTTAVKDDTEEWRFRTTHRTNVTGRDYYVRHHIVKLFFKPIDESGLASNLVVDETEEDEDDLT